MFKVVTKAAIYSGDKSKVLVIYMDRNNDYGLPGGHIEEGENLDDAMRRELLEECGVTVRDLQKSCLNRMSLVRSSCILLRMNVASGYLA